MSTTAIAADHVAEPIKFAHYLEAMALGVPGKRSGRRTRLKLMAATAKLLEEMVFTEMNVIDICNQADVAKGTFYLQFEAKEDIILAIFEEYIEFEIRTMPVLEHFRNQYEGLYALVAWYEQTFRVNTGIMRTFVRLSDIDPKIAEFWKKRNDQIVDRAIATYIAATEFTKRDVELARLAIRSLGGIMDAAMFARYGIHQGSDFTADYSDTGVIEMHTTLMYRALYGEDPPAESITPTIRKFVSRAKAKK